MNGHHTLFNQLRKTSIVYMQPINLRAGDIPSRNKEIEDEVSGRT